MEYAPGSAALPGLARFVAVFGATFFAGITSAIGIFSSQPIIKYAPTERVMAAQWYYGYQTGPTWVPPLVGPATMANVYLAMTTDSKSKQSLYFAAAACIFSIFPFTFLYMEPGINGACKWRAQSLLKDEGFHLPETSIYLPSAKGHGSTQASRRWAERTHMRDLIACWQKFNHLRWAVAAVSAVLSGYATFVMRE